MSMKWLTSTLACSGFQAIGVYTLIGLLIYFTLTCAIFIPIEKWSFTDAMYFGVVTLTTVGYGDRTPSRDATRMVTTFYVLFATAMVWSLFSYSLVTLSRRLRKTARKHIMKRAGGLLKSSFGISSRLGSLHWVRFLEVLVLFVVFIGATSIFASLTVAKSRRELLEADNEDAAKIGSDWVTGYYFTIISITTVGYGDVRTSFRTHRLAPRLT